MILQPLCAVAVILWGLLPNDTPFQDSVYRAVSWGWVQFIGLASYSLYIAHDVVMAPLRTVFERWPLALSGGVVLFCGTAAGVVVYLGVERPVLAWRRRRNIRSLNAVVRPDSTRYPMFRK